MGRDDYIFDYIEDCSRDEAIEKVRSGDIDNYTKETSTGAEEVWIDEDWKEV